MSSFTRALLQKDVNIERDRLEAEAEAAAKKASKKSLWSSIGSTVGALAATAITGGAASPLLAGALKGGLSYIGGEIGRKQAGDIPKISRGNFLSKERKDLKDTFSKVDRDMREGNLVSSIKTGLMAGVGQKLKLDKLGVKGKGLDFKGSMAGKGIAKMKSAKLAKDAAKAKETLGGKIGLTGQSMQAELDQNMKNLFTETVGPKGAIRGGDSISSLSVPLSEDTMSLGELRGVAGGGRAIDSLADTRMRTSGMIPRTGELETSFVQSELPVKPPTVPYNIPEENTFYSPDTVVEQFDDSLTEFGEWGSPAARPLPGVEMLREEVGPLTNQLRQGAAAKNLYDLKFPNIRR